MLTICSPGTSRHLLTAQQHLTSEVLYLLLPHVQYLRSGGARRLVMVAAITAEAKHHHTAEGLCLYKPSNDKLTVRKQRLKMSIKFQYFLCTLTKSLSVEPQRSREEDRVYVSIGDWRYTSGTALGPLKPVFPLAGFWPCSLSFSCHLPVTFQAMKSMPLEKYRLQKAFAGFKEKNHLIKRSSNSYNHQCVWSYGPPSALTSTIRNVWFSRAEKSGLLLSTECQAVL